METKHTPGPWYLNNEGQIENDATSSIICELYDLHSPTTVVNARLIGAAPDLLDACKYFCNDIDLAKIDVQLYHRMKVIIDRVEGVFRAKPNWSNVLTGPQYKACSVLAAECLHKYGVLRMQNSNDATRMLHNANVAIGALALCCAEIGVSTEYLTLIQSGHIKGLEIISDKGRLYEHDYDFKG